MRVLEKIDTILFDLDDTLIVEYQSAEDSFVETIKLLDSPIDTGDFLQTIRKQAREEWYKMPTIDYSKRIGISSWEALWADFTGDHEQLKKLRELVPGYRLRSWHQTLIHFGIDDSKLQKT
jgi:FMN phosphatase YigB (HAD superfamily)